MFSRKREGGPGYTKGSKLLIGNGIPTDSGTYVNISSSGFPIRGADNQGRCYNIKTAISNSLNTTNYLI